MSGTVRKGGAETPRSDAPVEGAGVTQFGKYQLFASLGRGGMADVFLSVARGQMGFNKLAVIKRLRPALAEEEAFRNMFLDEARLTARLNHPNIVHTYEVGETSGAYYIAMEYLEGQALNKVQKELVRHKQRMQPEIAVRIIADALAGLGYAHELRDYDGSPLNVIHRDVSPHNLFVTYEGHTKLVDFGIAKANTSSTETEVGILKGKVAYMSPEQAMGTELDQRSDLFAMGIVLWELLAQQRLLTGDNAANTLHKLMNGVIPHIKAVAPGIDMELDRLVAVSLEKDPNRRFQSAAEMRDALEAWLVSRPSAPRQEDVGRAMNRLFGAVRGDVQRQIQRHMALITTAKDTAELQALTAESLERMQAEGGQSGALLRLGTHGSGSGSGVIANYGGLAQQYPSGPPSGFPSFPPASPSMASGGQMPIPIEEPRSNALLIVITIGCFLLAGLLIVVFGFRRREPLPIDANPPTPSMTTAATAAPTETATNEPITAATVTEVSTKPAPPPPIKPVKPTSPSVKPASPTPGPGPAEEPGFVTVSAYPWAKVTEGGRVVCPITPCSKVSMSPGTHSLTFENGSDPSQKQTITVQIKSGETTPKNIGFK